MKGNQCGGWCARMTVGRFLPTAASIHPMPSKPTQFHLKVNDLLIVRAATIFTEIDWSKFLIILQSSAQSHRLTLWSIVTATTIFGFCMYILQCAMYTCFQLDSNVVEIFPTIFGSTPLKTHWIHSIVCSGLNPLLSVQTDPNETRMAGQDNSLVRLLLGRIAVDPQIRN